MKRIDISKNDFSKLNTTRCEYLYLKEGNWLDIMMVISAISPDNLKFLFGKADFRFSKAEYKPQIWSFENEEGYKFFLISANVRGCTLECFYEYFSINIKKDRENIEKFVNFIIEKLKSLNEEHLNFWISQIGK